MNTKKVWSKINEILQHNTKNSDDIFLDINGHTVSNHKLAANKFNNYVINVAQNLLNDLGDTNNQFQDYLKNPNEHSFFLKETEPQEVFEILRELNAKKATDVYRISPKFIRTAADVLKNHLTTLFNHSIN